jgi:hypothetical protein
MQFLLGLPGKVQTLLTRLSATWAAKLDTLAANYTTTRAGKLDNLDAAITTTAPAATALSTAVWTSALAAIIAAQTRVKNIQYVGATVAIGGTGNANTTVAITAVDWTKALLFPLGVHCSNGVSTYGQDARWEVTNSTTLTMYASSYVPLGTANITAGACVLEFY